jgi:choline dehydrogenase-like flavoprotein
LDRGGPVLRALVIGVIRNRPRAARWIGSPHFNKIFVLGPSPKIIRSGDWGIAYSELESYYTRAEKMMGISGKAGNLRGQLVFVFSPRP